MNAIFELINANIMAVMLFFSMIFILASKSKRFRNFILPTYLISMTSSILMIYLDVKGIVNLTNDSYLVFYHLVYVSFTFIETLNAFMQVILGNMHSLLVVFKILFTGDTRHLIHQLFGFSINYLKSNIVGRLNIEKSNELVFNTEFVFNKNLHTFNELKVVFNC